MFSKYPFVALAIAGLIAATAVPLSLSGQAKAPDAMLGTWKLNPAKSTASFRSGTTVVEAANGGIRTTVDLVTGDGTPYHFTWAAKYDGKDNPVRGTSPYGSGTHVIALTRIDARTAKIVTKLDGKVVITQTLVVAIDGRTRTVTTTGRDANSKAIESVSVYERQ